MTIEQMKKLQEERLALHAQMKALADRQAEWKAEDEAEWQKLNAAYDAVHGQIEAGNAELKRAAEIRQRMEQVEAHAAAGIPDAGGVDGASLSRPPVHDLTPRSRQHEQQFALALQGWCLARGPHEDEIRDEHRQAAAALRMPINSSDLVISISPTRQFRAFQRLSRQPRAALTTFDGPAGGYLVPDGFIPRIEMAMLAFGGMLRVSEVIRTSTGETLPWPSFDDTSNTGEQVGETHEGTGDTQPTVAQTKWGAYLWHSKSLKISYQLLRDSAFDLVGTIADMLGERLGRILNTRFTTGTGAATAKGIVTCATAGVTTAGATAITLDEVIDLEHSIDSSRRNLPGVGYMFNDTTLALLRKLKTGDGIPLWQSGVNSGAPDLLNGYPYTINQDMAGPTASQISMLFGQLSNYKIRQVGTIRLYRLLEKYKESDQEAFGAFTEADGNLLDAGDHPVKKMTQHA